jgi:uncharacterized LabA/DUF88 family protein
MFFIDGQNLHYACRRHFGHGNCHVDLLANELLEGRVQAGIRFYTGIHNPSKRPDLHAQLTRRLTVMEGRGIWIYTHRLRYSECDFVDRTAPPCDHGYFKVDSHEVGREKGIDLRIGLDMLRLARHRQYDVAVLVSEDADLNQAVNELMDLREELGIWLAVEHVYAHSPSSGFPGTRLASCKRELAIDPAMFESIRDDTDYTKPLRHP